MDARNYFDTKITYSLVRAEFLVALLVCVALALAHFDEIRWVPALVLFFYIDLLGYIPGALYCRLRRTNHPPRFFYVIYNVMHSGLTQGAVAGAWILVFGPEWALLAIPIHLLADRGIFGNQMKVFSMPFEPVRIQPFTELLAAVQQRQTPDRELVGGRR